MFFYSVGFVLICLRPTDIIRAVYICFCLSFTYKDPVLFLIRGQTLNKKQTYLSQIFIPA